MAREVCGRCKGDGALVDGGVEVRCPVCDGKKYVEAPDEEQA